ncbi:TIGR03619 family F420-dependent LLM class oxidoreductase [Mycobacterium vicinigordonae]|uniref:TIGR03619 family F420-dependent LLM class oxidoreductase n=1 Tax=Mycobacterium vicinigordonae TaxID=1719132 RepID=A0A7D6EBH9_9MYCO|nr:TIGR03619 family F420-dependent LLM class oxidoreductase [Mycobacterium vicinigordonae]QLL09125.1 TIGR03619 family F420-dependent LLM class oxidoreductase [Mycobacterium vicinigordonae]
MKFCLEYPSDVPTATADFMSPEAMIRVAKAAESAGFDGLCLSDHPAPSAKWRHSGGHDTFDVAVALGFFAAATKRIRLITNLWVLPFRNPYLSAKALTSLDIVSGGRLTAGVGAGYLRSEFAALGVAFDRRAALLDEALHALVDIWTNPDRGFSGEEFTAHGPMWLQRPVQTPHPPLWIGGNSAAARRRVVSHGQGWCPVIAPPSMATSIRTETIDGVRSFEAAVRRLDDQLEAAGRRRGSVDIQIEAPKFDFSSAAATAHAIDDLNELSDAGATWALVHVDASSVNAALDYIAGFAETVARETHGRTEHRKPPNEFKSPVDPTGSMSAPA